MQLTGNPPEQVISPTLSKKCSSLVWNLRNLCLLKLFSYPKRQQRNFIVITGHFFLIGRNLQRLKDSVNCPMIFFFNNDSTQWTRKWILTKSLLSGLTRGHEKRIARWYFSVSFENEKKRLFKEVDNARILPGEKSD